MRQHLREAVKRVLIGHLVESTLTSGNILKLLPTIAGGNFTIFVVMIPQESGIGAGVSLSETDLQDLGISIKFHIEYN